MKTVQLKGNVAKWKQCANQNLGREMIFVTLIRLCLEKKYEPLSIAAVECMHVNNLEKIIHINQQTRKQEGSSFC